MSLYAVSKALFGLNLAEGRREYLADPAGYVRSLKGLESFEQHAILERDVNRLHEMGVSIYLIRTLELVHRSGIVETGLKFGGLGPRVVQADGGER